MVGERKPVPAPAATVSKPVQAYIAWEIASMALVENLLIDMFPKLGREIQKR
jgi:hypothetical protein